MSLLEHLQSVTSDLEARLGSGFREVSGEATTDVDRALAGVEADITEFIDQLKASVVKNPEPVFAILRRIRPILMVKNVAVVTRFDDVQEVLSRDDIFQVTYGPKMEIVTGSGNFFPVSYTHLTLPTNREV